MIPQEVLNIAVGMMSDLEIEASKQRNVVEWLMKSYREGEANASLGPRGDQHNGALNATTRSST